MSMDHFSPVRPAAVRVLVLPVGRIERPRFSQLVRRLQQETNLIPLADVEQRADSDGVLLSPNASAPGSLLYRFSAAVPSDQQLQLSPFELFREPLLVLGIVDGLQSGEEEQRKELAGAAAYLKEQHPRVVHRQLIVLQDGRGDGDGDGDGDGSLDVSDKSNAIAVANADSQHDPSLRAAICKVSARFLVEFTTYAKAVHASPTIQTPGQTARSLQRSGSLRESERMTSPGTHTPTNSISVGSPSEDGSPRKLPSMAPPMPATSFDQIPSANAVPASTTRPESRASNQSNKGRSGRAASQDRVSVQGFGSSTTQEKARMRGKARVGILYGSIHMMAGHWSEALRILVEHTSKARTLGDHLWHAKGLENMMVCMVLLAWTGSDFQVPSLCDPVAERTGSSNAARTGLDARMAAEGMQRQIVRLSVAIPDLSKLILSLYRSTEGSLELPFLVPAEATVRITRLLATLRAANGELSPSKLRPLVMGPNAARESDRASRRLSRQPSGIGKARPLSKATIAELLAQALPIGEDAPSAGDRIRLLSGIASTYAMLGMERKKAMTIKDLVVRLTQALIQARKLGAAEMGIHPAASLSVESGAETLMSVAEESSGLNDLMADVSRIYGATLVPSTPAESSLYIETKAFGNPQLKADLLRDLANFCEASPDPYGVLSLTTSLLRIAGPNAAIDESPDAVTNLFSREDQMHLATVVHRTVAVSRHLGLRDVHAVYWDPFLVRGVEILQPVGQRSVIDRTKIHAVEKAVNQPLGPGNPLLYDPSASRPGTAAKQTYLLIQNEPSECLITLQNPFDIPVDIETLELVTDGVDLASSHSPTTLGPLRFQQVSLNVFPKEVGSSKITGCRIKMQGCHEQIFPIVTPAWSAQPMLTVKDLGLDARPKNIDAQQHLKDLGIEPETVSATVIDEVPMLVLENTSQLESGLMLLEGESRSLELILRNTGGITATVFEATDTADVLRRDDEHKLKVRGVKHKRSKSFLPTTTVAPGDCITFRFRVEGKAGLSSTQANFYYRASASDDTKHARVVSVPVVMTVNAALQVQHFDIVPPPLEHDTKTLLVSFDIRNAWPKAVFYECFNRSAPRPQDPASAQDGQLSPGEIRRVYLTVPHAVDGVDFEGDADMVRMRFLDQLHVSWRVEEHSGYVDLLGLALSEENLDLIRGAPVSLVVEIAADEGGSIPDVIVGSSVPVRVRMFNRSKRTGPLSVQLRPRAADTGREDRRVAAAGTLRRILSPLGASEELVVDFVLCPLLAGRLEVEATAGPAQIGRYAEQSPWVSRKAMTLHVKAASP